MAEKPWWHPTDEDNWDEPLPEVVVLSPDYSAKLPLWGDGQLAWQRTKFSPQLLDRLAAWQEQFDSNFHWDNGWNSEDTRQRWATEADQLAAAIRAELAGRAELVLDLWPLQDEKRD